MLLVHVAKVCDKRNLLFGLLNYNYYSQRLDILYYRKGHSTQCEVKWVTKIQCVAINRISVPRKIDLSKYSSNTIFLSVV